MTPEFFQDQIKRLKTRYGSNSYPSEVSALLFERYEKIPAPDFKEAVDKWITTTRTAPLRNEMDEVFIHILSKIAEQERINLQKGLDGKTCKHCSNSGFIVAYDRDCNEFGYKTVYAFRCNCPMGKVIPSKVPFWSELNYGQKYVRSELV